MLLLFDWLRSSYLTYCSTPFAQFDVPFVWPTLPLLLFDLFCYCYSTCCSILFARPLCLGTFLLHPWFCCSLLLLFDLVILLFLFYIGIPPRSLFCRCGVWRSYPNSSFSNSSSLGQTWKARIFVFNFCLLMSSFNYPCFWEMVVNNVFVFLCKNYLDIIHLIIHIASHFYTLHFVCTIALCIFWAHCIFFFQLLVNV